MAGSTARTSQSSWPGKSIGLPQTGRGSLASWRSRFTALVLDWAASMGVAIGAFGTEVLTGHGWQQWMILAVFFVESAVLSALTGGSFGQLLCRIAVFRLDAKPLGFGRSVPRAAMTCLVIPPLVVDENRRGLPDLALGTVVINRR